jgi:hypothetical protein
LSLSSCFRNSLNTEATVEDKGGRVFAICEFYAQTCESAIIEFGRLSSGRRTAVRISPPGSQVSASALRPCGATGRGQQRSPESAERRAHENGGFLP